MTMDKSFCRMGLFSFHVLFDLCILIFALFVCIIIYIIIGAILTVCMLKIATDSPYIWCTLGVTLSPSL